MKLPLHSLSLGVLAFLALAPAPAVAAPASPTKPNVLFIAIDDLNHWVGYLGRNSQTRTPHLDRLATRGVWFTRSYCAAPLCNPSRAALLSGLRPSTTGCYQNEDDFTQYIPEEITLPSAFRKAGYFVCGAGKIYHGSKFRPGEWEDTLAASARGGGGAEPDDLKPVLAGKLPITPLSRTDEQMPDYQTVSYGIEQLNKKHDKPLFLAIGLVKPHLPWSVPGKYYDKFPLETIELPPYREDDLNDLPPAGVRMATRSGDHQAMLQGGTNTWKQAVRAYLATINFCDAMVGRLLEALSKSPLRDNTIVCLWSDHGWHLGEKHHWRKFALWEEATRAPFIMVVPGLTPANVRCDRTVDFMSIYPTLTDLCGLPTPGHVQGRSLRPLLVNPKAEWSEPALCTYGFQNHTVRSEAWRYIRYADGGEELYDEVKDPYEWVNLAGQAEWAPRKTELARWLPTDNKPDAPAPAGGTPKAKAKAKAKNP